MYLKTQKNIDDRYIIDMYILVLLRSKFLLRNFSMQTFSISMESYATSLIQPVLLRTH